MGYYNSAPATILIIIRYIISFDTIYSALATIIAIIEYYNSTPTTIVAIIGYCSYHCIRYIIGYSFCH